MPPTIPGRGRTLTGAVALMLGAMALLPFLDVVAKHLGQRGLPVMQAVWARMIFGAVLTLPFVQRIGGAGALLPDRPALHLVRAGLLFDHDPAQEGDQDGLLETRSDRIGTCAADWSGKNGIATQSAYDITGNLREITQCQLDRTLCGSAAQCAARCCAKTSTELGTAPATYRLCGAALPNARRLAGLGCTVNADCCNNPVSCNGNGTCVRDVANEAANTYCKYSGTAPSCRARGVACSATNQCCDGETCLGGVCGGPTTLTHTTYPAMGGSCPFPNASRAPPCSSKAPCLP